jgi:ABC-type sugar transport system substrate-binding protein
MVVHGSLRLRAGSTTGRAALAAWLVACAVGCAGTSDKSSPRANPSTTLAAVIKGLDNPFFATMRDGLVATARQHNARLSVDAAAGLQDTAGQASTLESLAAQRADCYVANPINTTNLISPLSHFAKGTPIVNIDSPVDRTAADAVGVKITTYIGTDNVAAGLAAADAMAGFVDRGAGVTVIAGISGDATSEARSKGFTEGARGRFVVTQTIPADFDRKRAMFAAAELLRSRPAVGAFFAVNDEMALGIADAVRTTGTGGKVVIIGLDGIPEALAAVNSGALSATIAQYPFTIGQLGVEACLAALRGKSVPAKVDSPVQVVTRDNVARAQANFPQPVNPFRNPLTRLLAK